MNSEIYDIWISVIECHRFVKNPLNDFEWNQYIDNLFSRNASVVDSRLAFGTRRLSEIWKNEKRHPLHSENCATV